MEEDENNMANDKHVLFAQRTVAKRLHTKLITRIGNLLKDKPSANDLRSYFADLEEALRRIIALHTRYTSRPNLTEEEAVATTAWLNDVQESNESCLHRMKAYLSAIDHKSSRKGKRQCTQWNVSQHKSHVENDVSESSKHSQLPLVDTNIDLEMQLQQARSKHEHTLAEVKRRGEENLSKIQAAINERNGSIQRNRQSIAQPFTSTPIASACASLLDRQPQRYLQFNTTSHREGQSPAIQYSYPPPGPSSYPPPAHWPKIPISKFNGDCRRWPAFAQVMRATIEETALPDLYKVLALRENLTEDIQKRMAHLFNGSYNYSQAWNELKNKYGVSALIIQAHIHHLQMVQPFRNGDFKSLAELASLVRDAVSSVAGDPSMIEFTHSIVVNQLATKLPFNLQQDWGRYAYNLRPKISSLADFDCWLDAIVGAEELRGAKISSYIPPKQNPSMRSAVVFPPTILNASIHETSERPGRANNEWPACLACNDSPGHRLEACVIFRKMLPSQRAAFCGQNNHCFKCLRPGHYGRSCGNTDITCNACPGKHHTLIHGADRVFLAGLSRKIRRLFKYF
ncbi:uncharacterized protein LOC123467496 [Daphnia magna]|uniref:uncharacterized protein LOC123467496 n=1 Tax=Daphnia magna TaxID=35525 RepID=UPI001E1BCE90|nr:uncharacterized protein LOC123467496 [Daphnia magna]